MNDTEDKPSYNFIHPLKYSDSSPSITYFNVSANIKTDLDLISKQTEENIKLYDLILNDINDIKRHTEIHGCLKAPLKTKSQQRVYDVLTNIVFDDAVSINANKELVTIVGKNVDKNLLCETIHCQETIENIIFDKELNSDFYDSHNYIDYKPVEFVNRSSKIMGFLNIYTLSTPLLTLLMPLAILLIPFLTMKVKGIHLSFSAYFTFLKDILSRIPAFRIFTFASNDTIGSKISALAGFILYFVQLYYNTKYCVRYVNKNHDIHNIILTIKKVINNSIEIITNIKDNFSNSDITQKLSTLYTLKEKLHCFENEYSVLSLNHVNTIGHKLKLFYEFISDHKNIQNTLKSIFDLNTFFYYYNNIYTNIDNKYLQFYKTDDTIDDGARENTENECVKFKNIYFPMLLLEKNNTRIVHNSLTLNKSYIISGPNASGKTTMLKSTLFNVLCTQQFGCGFYEECVLRKPFSVIDSYINILDTHDRHSLFQNEAKRMLDIITKIEKTRDDKLPMFFVFDELFSGTNPTEATSCGIACLTEILSHSNVKILLTTHYDGICKHFKDKQFSSQIYNKQMACRYVKNKEKSISSKSKIKYDYLIKDGISNIHGGLTVLREMGFNNTILNNAETLLFNK
jgi:hypothetical protein